MAKISHSQGVPCRNCGRLTDVFMPFEERFCSEECAMGKARCCKIDCDKLAEYEVREPQNPAPENYVHSCLEHIPDLMTDAVVHEVVKLTAPGDASPVYV